MTLTNIYNRFIPNYDNTGDLALKNQNTLRRLVGSLGILLPLLVYLFLQLTDDFDPVLPSISHYYFTRAASIFEIIVSLLAFFLLIYKGEELMDYILSSIAGISALLMLIFPTSNLLNYNCSIKYNSVAVTNISTSEFRPLFHFGCAALFLVSLAIMSLYLFTKSAESVQHEPRKKKLRNGVYYICGFIMLAALFVAFLGNLKVNPNSFYEKNNLTFWMEVISVVAFGIAWIVKGEEASQKK